MKQSINGETVRRLLIVPPVAVGLVVLLWFRSNAREPQRKPESEDVRILRVIKVPRCNVVPQVLAYGTAEPGQIWRAVSEVKGRVTAVHPELRAGSVLRKGEVVLEVDRTEYDLTITQLHANISQAQAQLEELSARETNDQQSLAIEQASLAVSEREQARLEKLRKDNAATQADLDTQTRQTLSQRQSVQSRQNSLNLAPSQQAALKATIAAEQATLKRAQIDAEKTKLVTPYDCRLADVGITVGQFLAGGELLFEAHSTALAEVEAQVPVDQASTLITPRETTLGTTLPSMEAIRDVFRLKASVTNATGSDTASWHAKFLRVRETIDPHTRTVGIVVGVEKPYEKIIPGRRPPLLQGTFCRVTLTGETRVDRVVIPRSAIRAGGVYVLDSDSRLRRRKIELEFAQRSFAVVTTGLQGGEQLVVSDPAPAIDGMLVIAQPDDSLLTSIVAEATDSGDGSQESSSD